MADKSNSRIGRIFKGIIGLGINFAIVYSCMLAGNALKWPGRMLNYYASQVPSNNCQTINYDSQIYGNLDIAGNDSNVLNTFFAQSIAVNKGSIVGGSAFLNGNYIFSAGHVDLNSGEKVYSNNKLDEIIIMDELIEISDNSPNMSVDVSDISVHHSNKSGLCIPIGSTPSQGKVLILGYPLESFNSQTQVYADIIAVSERYAMVNLISEDNSFSNALLNQGFSGSPVFQNNQLIGVAVGARTAEPMIVFYRLDYLQKDNPELFDSLTKFANYTYSEPLVSGSGNGLVYFGFEETEPFFDGNWPGYRVVYSNVTGDSNFITKYAPFPGLGDFNYSYTAQGFLIPQYSGIHRICVESDEKSELHIGSYNTSFYATSAEAGESCLLVPLIKGEEKGMVVNYMNTDAYGQLQVTWSLPGAFEKQLIPQSQMRH